MPDPAATTEEAPEEASWSGPVGEVRIIPVQGIPEIVRDCDLGAVIGGAIAAGGEALRDGDILAVTSKIASKALGLTAVRTDKRAVVREQSVRVVAERMTSTGATRIVEGRHGVVMAGAGIDASNTGPAETLLLLPDDPDEVARDGQCDCTSGHLALVHDSGESGCRTRNSHRTQDPPGCIETRVHTRECGREHYEVHDSTGARDPDAIHEGHKWTLVRRVRTPRHQQREQCD